MLAAGVIGDRWSRDRATTGIRRVRGVAAVSVAAFAVACFAVSADGQAGPSNGDTGVRDASGGTGVAETEQTLAVDPADPRNVLIGMITQGSVGGDTVPGNVAVSHDGGLSWKLVTVIPNGCGDNNPAFDRSGVAYFQCDASGVQVFRSLDAGDHWSPAILAASSSDNGGDAIDRPWITVDRTGGPRDGTVYVSWESFFTNPVGSVRARSSADGGKTWRPVQRVDDPAHPAMQDPRQYPAVGADGTLYVVYASGQNPLVAPQVNPISLVVARSHDGGASFERSVAAAGLKRSSAPTEESEEISSLAADPSRAGHVALAWADERSGESRILLVDSVDGGVTWSAPHDIADDPPGRGNEHDHPQLAFARDGTLLVVWRDRRCCGGSFSSPYQLFARSLTIRDRGALSLGRTVQVTAGPQQPNASPFLDEYLGASAGPEGLSVAWNQPIGGVAASVYRRLPPSMFRGRAATGNGSATGSGADTGNSSRRSSCITRASRRDVPPTRRGCPPASNRRRQR